MRYSALLALLPLALAAPAKRTSLAPLRVPENPIEGKYIVKLREGASLFSIASEAKPDFEYTGPFNGFAGSLTSEELENLRNNPDVEYIEQDGVVTTQETITQTGATWGIARLSSTAPGSTTYTYDESAGEGTCAFVIDTGIYVEHPELEGRAAWAANFVDTSSTDGNGHGTHVAGTIGSKTYGVAKKTSLYAVKVLNASGSGTFAGVIAGMDYVTANASTYDCPNGVVVNMSLGGSTSTAVNDAANNIVAAGYFLAVAAGNSATSAASFSPASAADACTVGATTSTDGYASYSNYGTLVDILAPGTSVLSIYNNGGTATLSGTSMASPHIAGLGAYYLGLGESAVGLCAFLASIAQSGAISGVRSDTVNLLGHIA